MLNLRIWSWISVNCPAFLSFFCIAGVYLLDKRTFPLPETPVITVNTSNRTSIFCRLFFAFISTKFYTFFVFFGTAIFVVKIFCGWQNRILIILCWVPWLLNYLQSTCFGSISIIISAAFICSSCSTITVLPKSLSESKTFIKRSVSFGCNLYLVRQEYTWSTKLRLQDWFVAILLLKRSSIRVK
jgi:hypothetical protein